MPRQRRKNKQYKSNGGGKSTSPLVAASDPKSDSKMGSSVLFPPSGLDIFKPKPSTEPKTNPEPTQAGPVSAKADAPPSAGPEDWGPIAHPRPNDPRRMARAEDYGNRMLANQVAQPSPSAPRPEITPQDTRALDQQAGPLGGLPAGLQNEVRARAAQERVLGGQPIGEYQAQTAAIQSQAARAQASADALAQANTRNNANINAIQEVTATGQAPVGAFGSLQDAQRLAAPGGQVGLNTGNPGAVNYAGLLPPELQARASTDRAVTLAGRPIDAPPVASLDDLTQPPTQSQQDILDRRAEGADTVEGQQAIIDRIQNDSSIAGPNLRKAAEQKAARRAIGAQRREDSRQARLNGTTPEIEAQKREIEGRVQSSKQAEIEATRVARRRESFQSQIESTAAQMKEMHESYRTLSRAIGEGAEDPASLLAQQKEAFREYRELKKAHNDLQMKLQTADVPPKAASALSQLAKDPNARRQFEAANGMTVEEHFDRIYGDGASAYLLKRSL